VHVTARCRLAFRSCVQGQFNVLLHRAEAAEAATLQSDHQLEAAQARAAALQRELAASAAEVGRMSQLATGADAAASSAERGSRHMEGELAKAHAHIAAVESSLADALVSTHSFFFANTPYLYSPQTCYQLHLFHFTHAPTPLTPHPTPSPPPDRPVRRS
jgi:hypothetical protein